MRLQKKSQHEVILYMTEVTVGLEWKIWSKTKHV